MIWAVLGGLGAAGAWTVSTLASSRSSRLIDPASVVAGVMITGLLIAGPIALAGGIPRALHGPAWAWLGLAGAGNVLGLLLAYLALRTGQVALVAPIVSTEGAMAAVIAVLAGEHLSLPAAIVLLVIVVGIALAAVPERAGSRLAGAHHARAVVPALGAVVAFGASLYAAGRAATLVPSAWVALSARAVGVPALALPLALSGRLRLTRRALPLVLAAGVCEVLGFYAYTGGARHAIAVAAVISSQFGSFAALGGFLLYRERLTRTQLAGVLIAMAGVALLAVIRA